MPLAEAENLPLVLVIDDDAISRLLIREALGNSGQFRVLEAADGAAGLAMFRANRPDVVLLDVVMEGMDGFTTCMAMRGQPGGEHVPILMLTGLDDVDSIHRAYEAGATDFVTKPINHIILAQRLHYMLRATRAAEALRASEKRLTKAQRLAHLGHWEWQPQSNGFHASEELLHILGLAPGTRLNHPHDLLRAVHDDDIDRSARLLDKALAQSQPLSMEYRIVDPAGNTRIVSQEIEAYAERPGEPPRWLGTLQDISERRRAEEKIIRLAYYDALTGLPNRAFLVDYLGYYTSQAGAAGQRLGLIFLDLDHFKRINNTWGIGTGNQLLQHVAQRLRESLQLGDCLECGCNEVIECLLRQSQPFCDFLELQHAGNTLARLGGDEFALLLGQPSDEALSSAALVIGEALSHPFHLHRRDVFLTASQGIAIFPSDGADAETLLSHAELAMHHAKSKGRNQFQFYRQSMNVQAKRRMILESELHHALEKGEMELHYQPKVHLPDYQPIGMEALIRWRHPHKGMISPMNFIPLAEESDLIVKLGAWVLETACRQTHAWREAGLCFKVAVNLSARQFRNKRLARVIGDALAHSGLSPVSLELEITEGILLEDNRSSQRILSELKEMGLKIALDDFGTGYSSLSYLRQFPLDMIKIDRSFIRDLPHDEGSRSITSAIVALSKCLKLEVVAEGVEQAAQLDFLCRQQCDEIQGYLFARPMPADELPRWIEQFRATRRECAPWGESEGR
jgi:PAS domain S-box-containing protein